MNIKDDTRISDNLLIVNAVAMQTSGVGDYVYRVEQPSIAMGTSSLESVNSNSASRGSSHLGKTKLFSEMKKTLMLLNKSTG